MLTLSKDFFIIITYFKKNSEKFYLNNEFLKNKLLQTRFNPRFKTVKILRCNSMSNRIFRIHIL